MYCTKCKSAKEFEWNPITIDHKLITNFEITLDRKQIILLTIIDAFDVTVKHVIFYCEAQGAYIRGPIRCCGHQTITIPRPRQRSAGSRQRPQSRTL